MAPHILQLLLGSVTDDKGWLQGMGQQPPAPFGGFLDIGFAQIRGTLLGAAKVRTIVF